MSLRGRVLFLNEFARGKISTSHLPTRRKKQNAGLLNFLNVAVAVRISDDAEESSQVAQWPNFTLGHLLFLPCVLMVRRPTSNLIHFIPPPFCPPCSICPFQITGTALLVLPADLGDESIEFPFAAYRALLGNLSLIAARIADVISWFEWCPVRRALPRLSIRHAAA